MVITGMVLIMVITDIVTADMGQLDFSGQRFFLLVASAFQPGLEGIEGGQVYHTSCSLSRCCPHFNDPSDCATSPTPPSDSEGGSRRERRGPAARPSPSGRSGPRRPPSGPCSPARTPAGIEPVSESEPRRPASARCQYPSHRRVTSQGDKAETESRGWPSCLSDARVGDGRRPPSPSLACPRPVPLSHKPTTGVWTMVTIDQVLLTSYASSHTTNR